MIRAGLSLAGAFLVLAAGAHAAGGPVVVIDAGHDRLANAETEPIGPGSATRKVKDGGGTSGVVTRIREADLVLDVSLRLRTLLRRAGVTVVMTRTRTTGRSMGNIARARIANRAGAALFLRVHADGHPDSSVRGTHTLVPALRTGWTDDVYRRAAAPQRRSSRARCPRSASPTAGSRSAPTSRASTGPTCR